MNYKTGHVSESTALEVKNYPYGYTQRTTIRYWVETTKNGDRACSQTLNPKTGRWNAPKKSTYSFLVIMHENVNGHIKFLHLSPYYMDEQNARSELAKVRHIITDSKAIAFERAIEASAAYGRALKKQMEHATITSATYEMGANGLVPTNDEARRDSVDRTVREQLDADREPGKFAIVSGVSGTYAVRVLNESIKTCIGELVIGFVRSTDPKSAVKQYKLQTA